MKQTIHVFLSTGEAYDATQCNPDVKQGDTLYVPSEGVVGVACTWPIAVSAKHGDLHEVTARGLTDADLATLCEVDTVCITRARDLCLKLNLS